MTDVADPGPGRVLLEVDHELICSAAGDLAGVLPPELREPVGRDLLDLVHPVDRPLVRRWLEGGIGASAPFRRAHADEPARWFRLVAVVPAPGRSLAQVLLEDVTGQEREASLRRRLAGILAREPGPALLERGAALAAELVGTSHAWVGERFGPLLLLRSVHGERLAEYGGATIPLAGDPGEPVVASGQVRTYEAGLDERCADSPLVRVSGVRSAAAVPLRAVAGEPVRGVMVVASAVPRRFEETELELLALLGSRLAVEVARRRDGEAAAGEGMAAALQAALDALANAFANVLAAVGLNCELVLEDGPPERARERLRRVLEVVARGRWLARMAPGLGGRRRPSPSPVAAAQLLEGVREVFQLVAEGSVVEVSGSEGRRPLLVDEPLLLGAALLTAVPLATVVRPGLRVELRLDDERDVRGVRWGVLSCSVIAGEGRAEVWSGPDSVEAIRRAGELLGATGARLQLVDGPRGVRVEMWLPEAPPGA